MPETRVERGLFVLGLLAIAALGFLVVHLRRQGQAADVAPLPTSTSTATSASTVTRAITVPAIRAATTSKAATTKTTVTTRAATTTPALSARAVSLRLTAKTDTWFEVRSGSATGRLLYDGTLSAGSSRGFHARALWVRFGAAGNLSALLDSKALLLPSGTYSAAFGGHGFRRLGG